MTGIDCVTALKALGENTRLRMLRVLSEKQCSVNEIAERLEISQYNASKHLRILRDAQLLQIEKQGKLRLYTIAEGLQKHLSANNNILDLGCCTFKFDELPE